MKKTKIVCTIGPASSQPAMLVKMIKAGMNAARLNFSHGTYPDHARLIKNIRAAARVCGTEVAILQDLQGPRIRIGNLPAEGVITEKGDKVALLTEKLYSAKHKVPGYATVPNQYPGLYKDVKSGDLILIEDGTIRLQVERSSDGVIRCVSLNGGTIKNHKGINVPGVTLRADVITEKDKSDLAFGIKHGVDFVAISFVKNAEDIFRLKKIIASQRGLSHPQVIAKIERDEAVKNFDEILAATDGIMVARGDLGIELPAARVPLLQKEFIGKCLVASKPVIVATQMLVSMIHNPLPTRAEVSDVANAVIDHTDAVMLSGETATGSYPLEVVQTMSRIIEETENSRFDDLKCGPFHIHTAGEALVQAACFLESYVQAGAVVALTSTGKTVRTISRHRPELNIIAFTR
ncbi:pyruvate kinase, partial [Candidatus Uhrbacteria bacterium]|nr:pyruvate kinase [Candidatus Uhrbacteria bacterium]